MESIGTTDALAKALPLFVGGVVKAWRMAWGERQQSNHQQQKTCAAHSEA